MIHVFTSVVANYIPKARVLAHSLKRFHPDWRFHLVLPDIVPSAFSLAAEPFDSLITLNDLGIRNPEQWVFKHNLVEASTGVKGFAAVQLLEQSDCEAVLYFDPDIVILSRLDDLRAHFESASVLLTPHLAEPETEDGAILDNEFSVLQHGIYNLGFLGVKASAEGRRFAAWWRDRLRDYCYDDIPRGIFTDQRWADLAPAYFSECHILRDAIYNVCTWNLTKRPVDGRLKSGLNIGGRPVGFYHFSGFDSGAQQAMLDKYGATMPGLYELREWYIRECEGMGQQEFSKISWAYARYDNGEQITSAQRKLYRERLDVQNAFPQPFCTSDVNRSYYHWFQAAQRPQQTPERPPTLSNPNYRIYLSVTWADQDLARSTALAMLKTTYRQDALYLIGAEDVLRQVAQDDAIRQRFQLEPVCEGRNHADAFDSLLKHCDWDFVFVTPGVEPVSDWDLRLAWTARRQPGIATVSPLCGRNPLTSLDMGREMAARRIDTPPLASTVDSVCYQYSAFQLTELPEYSMDCVYVSSTAVQAARSLATDAMIARQSGYRTFLQLTQALRYSHVLADHVYVGAVEEKSSPSAIAPSVAALRHQVLIGLAGPQPAPFTVQRAMRPRQLHLMHSWGGGLEKWVRSYCRSDDNHTNFVLTSIGTWGSFGSDLWLHRGIDDATPVCVWRLDPPIKGTVDTHAGYAAALSEIVERFGIDQIVISSLIGHSLEALRYPLPKVMVCHDFYPFCPALNITFGEVCQECSESRLVACTKENPHHRFFRNVPPADWLALRLAFARAVTDLKIPLIAPTPSVRDYYSRLLPEIAGSFHVVPHGAIPLDCAPLKLEAVVEEEPLRIVVLGSIAPHKGGQLLEDAWREVRDACRLYLVGCGDYGKNLARDSRVTVLPQYRRKDLPKILDEIRPHVGLLPSVVPETFSYTLQELWEIGVPVLATRIGSFADRIEDGVNGFLCDPLAPAVVAAIRRLSSERIALLRVHQNLRNMKVRTMQEMLGDYNRLLPGCDRSAKAYFCADSRLKTGQEDARAQLYWSSHDQPYRDEFSVSVPFSTRRERQALRLPVPPLPSTPTGFRIYLVDRAGLILLEELRLRDAQDGLLWEWDGNWSTLENGAEHVLAMRIPTPQPGVLLYFTEEHAYIDLPVGVGFAKMQMGGMIEVEFTWAPPFVVGDAPPRLAEVGPARRGTSANTVEGHRLNTELAHARARIYDLENSLSWRISAPLRALGSMALRWRQLLR